MVLQRRRSLFVGLGLTVALVLAVALPATASAASTLTGETLSGSSLSGNTPNCFPEGSHWSVNGTAAGPYPGTFSESGSWNFDSSALDFRADATFTITSGTTTITGSKTGSSSEASCGPIFLAVVPNASYTTTIHTPNGNFHDEGSSAMSVAIDPPPTATLTESFTSSLTEPVLIGPTSKDQCKNNGWKGFPQFKNQGQCEKSVKV